MAIYTLTSKIVGSTGASGAQGYTATLAAQNTAMATAITTALAVTGIVVSSLNTSPAQVLYDTGSNIYSMTQTVTYIVQS